MVVRSFEASEYYPFWTLVKPTKNNKQRADFTEAEIADYERVMTAFEDWQDKIRRSFLALLDARDRMIENGDL